MFQSNPKEADYYIQYSFLEYGMSDKICMAAFACFGLNIIAFGEWGCFVGAFSKN